MADVPLISATEEGQTHSVIDVETTLQNFHALRSHGTGYRTLFLNMIFLLGLSWILSYHEHKESQVWAYNELSYFLKSTQPVPAKCDTPTKLWDVFHSQVIPNFLAGIEKGAAHVEQYAKREAQYANIFQFKMEAMSNNTLKPFHKKSGWLAVGNVSLTMSFSNPTKSITSDFPANTKNEDLVNEINASGTGGMLLLSSRRKDLRKLRIHAVVFGLGASGDRPSMGALTISASLLSGAPEVSHYLETYPYIIYPDSSYWAMAQLLGELSVCSWGLYWFMIPFSYALLWNFGRHSRADFGTGETEAKYLAALKYFMRWKGVPCGSSGVLLYGVPCVLYPCTVVLSLTWVYIIYLHHNLPELKVGGDDEAKEKVMRFGSWWVINKRAEMFSALLFGYRFLQYCAFQKRLSIVADTFEGIANGLLSLGFILCVTCFAVGTLLFLAPGAEMDPTEMPSLYAAFLIVVQSCFGVGKLPADTPIWVSLLFKMVVSMLVFKILIGLIMQSYKENVGKDPDHNNTSVKQELGALFKMARHKYWNHYILRAPYVPLEQVAFALRFVQMTGEKEKLDVDSPHFVRAHFVGFKGLKRFLYILNKLADQPSDDNDHKESPEEAELFERLRVMVCANKNLYGFKKVGRPELKFIFDNFGINPDVARNRLQTLITNHVKSKKQEDKVPNEMIKEVDRIMGELGQPRISAETDEEQSFDHQIIEVFDRFDIHFRGRVHVRMLSAMLTLHSEKGGLGLSLSRPALKHMVLKYGMNHDRSLSLAEFREVMRDHEVRGLRSVKKFRGLVKALTHVRAIGDM